MQGEGKAGDGVPGGNGRHGGLLFVRGLVKAGVNVVSADLIETSG